METDVKPKKWLSLRRVMVLGVVVALAAAAFATLALISTNLAQAQEGEPLLQPATPMPPVVGGSFAWGGAPAPLVLDMAVDQGIITAEQAEQIRAKLPEVAFTSVHAGEWAVNAPFGDFVPLDVETALQNAVDKGQITQAEADQILTDLAAGTLEFLAITDEGVFTDPENLPEGVMIEEGHASVEGSGMSIVIQSGGEGLPIPAPPNVVMAPFAAGLDSAIAEAVSEGIITQEQADQLLALAPEMGAHMVFSHEIAHAGLATPLLPNDWLLALVNEALQDAAADGKITTEQADSLHQQLSDALSE
jgi:hypothetical protein